MLTPDAGSNLYYNVIRLLSQPVAIARKPSADTAGSALLPLPCLALARYSFTAVFERELFN